MLPWFIQASLQVGAVDDPLEREADRIADQVTQAGSPAPLQRSCCDGRAAPGTERADDPVVRRKGASPNGRFDAPASVTTALREPGVALPRETRYAMERRCGYSLAGVRVHNGRTAAESAADLSARAYTVGRDIVFATDEYSPGTTEGLRLLTHELVHVIQQNAADPNAPATTVGSSNTIVKHGADAGSAGLNACGPAPVSPRVLRQTATNTPTNEASQAGGDPSQGVAQAVISALNQPDPVAGVGDFRTAFNLLNGQSMDVLLRVLDELAAQGRLSELTSNIGVATGVDVPRLTAAIQLVQFGHEDAASIGQRDVNNFADVAQTLPADQQSMMLDFVKIARNISTATAEGLAAMMASVALSGTQTLTPAVAGAVTAPVGPGAWSPPGNQPIPFYIGTQAHIGVAATYVAAHPGDLVFTNFIPISSILQQAAQVGLTPTPAALSSGQLALKPDILNLSPARRHLFEIKPQTLQTAGRAEAALYVAALVAAGVPVTLGPMGEPGTTGAIPAPGGVYTFETAEPGVIIYQYRRQQIVEVPAPATEMSTQRRFELRPLTQQQQVAITETAMAGTLLLIIMIALSPAGA